MRMYRTTVAIRDASEGDREVARQATLAAYQEYVETMPPSFWVRYGKHIVEALNVEAPAQQSLATCAEEVVGSVVRYPPGARAYGEHLDVGAARPEMRLLAVRPSVRPAMRGQGIGTALTCARVQSRVQRAERAGATAPGVCTGARAADVTTRAIASRYTLTPCGSGAERYLT
jgi:hypothetical protein